MSQQNKLTQVSEKQEVDYPDNWPDVPDGFELEEKTNFVGGGKEFIFISDMFDFRISTHTNIYSGTVRIDSDHRDYRLDSEEEVGNWLSSLFELYTSCIAIQFFPVDDIKTIRGVQEDCTVISYDKEDGLVEWEDRMDSLTPYKKWNIHNPKNIGSYKALIEFTGAIGSYMYIFENHIINIYSSGSKKTNESFVVPTYHLAFDELSQYSVDEFNFLYIDDSVKSEELVKEFL